MNYRQTGRPAWDRAAERGGRRSPTSLPPAAHTDVPPLWRMTPRAQAIALYWFELGRESGWVAGYDHAQREHWRLPDYPEAVAACIALGTLGIDRGTARRRGAA